MLQHNLVDKISCPNTGSLAHSAKNKSKNKLGKMESFISLIQDNCVEI